MKRFRICIESYLFNNSDYAESDVYYLESENLETAKETAERYIDNWNKENKQGVIYNVFSVSLEK